MSMNTPPERPSLPQPPGSLRQLEILVGEWDMAGIHPAFPSAVHGHSSFAWLMEGSLLVWHFEWEPPGPPSAISVIGHDDEAVDTCTMLYADERGVARIYRLRLADGVWTMWRESPGFSQRITGKLSADGNTIASHGELSRDGARWEQDLDVMYTRKQRTEDQ